MEAGQIEGVILENSNLQSKHLKRLVKVDIYRHDSRNNDNYHLLLVNDGQDLAAMDFRKILENIKEKLRPLIIVAIHCGTDRKSEYGMSVGPDYKGWGSKAASYELFIINELLPYIHGRFHTFSFVSTGFAGFSLGGLSALDIAWNHPEIFSTVGVFSGSLWWRSIDKSHKNYDPWVHRMMHKQVKESEFRKGMKFFFQCGEMDELEDRNKNGVIDSIDDTIDLMRLLMKKGYREGLDFFYLQMADGKHDVPSWAKAFPVFLEWSYKTK